MSDETKKIDDAELVEITGGSGIVELGESGVPGVDAGDKPDSGSITDRGGAGVGGLNPEGVGGNDDGMQQL